MAASIEIAGASRAQVRPAPAALNRHGRVDGTLMDISGGGAGLVIPEFVPKWCRVTLAIHEEAGSDDALVRAGGEVRRVQMLDRRPSYLVGIGFVDLSEEAMAGIAALIARVDGERPDGIETGAELGGAGG